MMKSPNFYDNATCPVKNNCGFYEKDSYDADEVLYYVDHCLRGGEGCGLKKHQDLTKKLK